MDVNDGALLSQPQFANGPVGAAGPNEGDRASSLGVRSVLLRSQNPAGLKRGADSLLESANPKKVNTISRDTSANDYRASDPRSQRFQNSNTTLASQIHHQSISDGLQPSSQGQIRFTLSRRHEESEVSYGGAVGEEQHQKQRDMFQQRPQSSVDTTPDTQFPIRDNWATFEQAASIDYSHDATFTSSQDLPTFNNFLGREELFNDHASPWTLPSTLAGTYQPSLEPEQIRGGAAFWNFEQLNVQAELSDSDFLPARPFTEPTPHSQDSFRQQSVSSNASSFDAGAKLWQRNFMPPRRNVPNRGYTPQPDNLSLQSSQGQANFFPMQTSAQYPNNFSNPITASNGIAAHITRMLLLSLHPTAYTTILAGDTAYYQGTFTPFPVPNDDDIASVKANGPHHVQRIFDAISHLPSNVNAAQESGVKHYTRYIEEKMVRNSVDPNIRHSRVAGRIFSAAVQLHEFQGHNLEADELASHTVIKGKDVVKTLRKQDKELNLLAILDIIVDTLSLYKLIVKDCVLSERSLMLCVKEPQMYIALKEQSKSSNGGRRGRN